MKVTLFLQMSSLFPFVVVLVSLIVKNSINVSTVKVILAAVLVNTRRYTGIPLEMGEQVGFFFRRVTYRTNLRCELLQHVAVFLFLHFLLLQLLRHLMNLEVHRLYYQLHLADLLVG